MWLQLGSDRHGSLRMWVLLGDRDMQLWVGTIICTCIKILKESIKGIILKHPPPPSPPPHTHTLISTYLKRMSRHTERQIQTGHKLTTKKTNQWLCYAVGNIYFCSHGLSQHLFISCPLRGKLHFKWILSSPDWSPFPTMNVFILMGVVSFRMTPPPQMSWGWKWCKSLLMMQWYSRTD